MGHLVKFQNFFIKQRIKRGFRVLLLEKSIQRVCLQIFVFWSREGEVTTLFLGFRLGKPVLIIILKIFFKLWTEFRIFRLQMTISYKV